MRTEAIATTALQQFSNVSFVILLGIAVTLGSQFVTLLGIAVTLGSQFVTLLGIAAEKLVLCVNFLGTAAAKLVLCVNFSRITTTLGCQFVSFLGITAEKFMKLDKFFLVLHASVSLLSLSLVLPRLFFTNFSKVTLRRMTRMTAESCCNTMKSDKNDR